MPAARVDFSGLMKAFLVNFTPHLTPFGDQDALRVSVAVKPSSYLCRARRGRGIERVGTVLT